MDTKLNVSPRGVKGVALWSVIDGRLTFRETVNPSTGGLNLTLKPGEALVISDNESMYGDYTLSPPRRVREIEPGVTEEVLVPDTPVEPSPQDPLPLDDVGTDANGSPVSDEADPLLEQTEGQPQ